MNEYDLAQFEIAQIQLNHKNDKKEYIQCYINVVNLRETSSSYFSLGMAYSHIYCLEDTKRAFSHALELDPTNEELAMKIGDFYVLVSQYEHALNVFCSYDRQVPNQLKIKIKIAHLYSITGQKDLALEIMEKIQQLPVELEYTNDKRQLYFYLKIAEIYCSMNDWKMSADIIKKALKIQRTIIDTTAEGSSQNYKKMKELVAETAFHLSLCYYYQGQLKHSIESVRYAFELGPLHEKYSKALAKLLYRNFQFEECLEICCKHLKEENIDINILVTKSLIVLSRYDEAFIKSNIFFVNNIHNSVFYNSKKFWIMISIYIYLLHILGKKSKIENVCKQLGEEGSPNYGMIFCKVSV
jgi:tetratricopeptide (TPR) repeat protein